MIAFDNETLPNVTREFERYVDVRFEFEDQDLRELRIGGYLRTNDVDAFRELLRSNLNVETTRRGDTILLQARNAPT